jgi:membrane associated rhomboid family serine protease
MPAWVFLVYWIGLQLLSFAVGDGQLDGVAYAVYVGGFAVGVLVAVVWKTMVPSADRSIPLAHVGKVGSGESPSL